MCNAITCIDPVTNLVELICINNKTSPHVSNQFKNCWLSRYPRCNQCVHDNGGKFIGWPFQLLLARFGIKNVTTTVKNPQSNAICERMHQTVGNILRTVIYTNPPANQLEANQVLDNALATAMHATRCAVNSTLQNSPGSIVYNRDMLIDVPLIADLTVIRDRRQALVDENLRRQNSKRREHTYTVGQYVWVKNYKEDKMLPKLLGPYPIVQVFTNGTVDIQQTPTVRDKMNLRWLRPHCQ